MNQPFCIGIDLGTSTTIASYIDSNGIPKYISDQQLDTAFLNSIVHVTKNLSTGVGASIEESGVYYAKECKRIIGKRKDNGVVEIQSQRNDLDFKIVANQENGLATCRFEFENGKFLDISPEAVAKMILERVTNFRKDKPIDAVITVPADFGVFQKNATFEAAKSANIRVLKLLPEPSAAAYYYFKKNPDKEDGNYLVFDFGGGTLDISLINAFRKDGQLELYVKWVEGDSTIGGTDFDNLVFESFVCPKLDELGIDLNFKSLTSNKNSSKQELKHKLIVKSKELKETLSRTGRDIRNYPIEYENGEIVILDIKYSEFKDRCEEKFKEKVQNLIRKFNIHSIDEVLMVGGTSLIPFVKEWIQEELKDVKRITQPNKDEAMYIVSYGAAYLARDLYYQKSIPITECLSRNIYIKEYQNMSYVEVFKKGEKLPCQKLLRITNSSDETTRIIVNLLEGELPSKSIPGLSTQTLERLSQNIVEIEKLPAKTHRIGIEAIVDHHGVLTINIFDCLKGKMLFDRNFTFENNLYQHLNEEIKEKMKELTEKVYHVKRNLSKIRQTNYGNISQATKITDTCITFVESFHLPLTMELIESELEKINHWYQLSLLPNVPNNFLL